MSKREIKRKRIKKSDYTPSPVKKDEQISYNNQFGQCRTQDQLRDFFQKSDLQWGHRHFEIGI